MNRLFPAVLTICLLLQAPLVALGQSSVGAESIQQSQSADATLRNHDVINLVKAALSPEAILAKLQSSKCDFDLSPEKLRELKSAEVPDILIVAMLEAAGVLTVSESPGPLPSQKAQALQLEDGTAIEIESPFTFTSLDFKPNDEISFRVVNPVKTNGITIIEQGATATGRVERAKRGGHFGKAGLLAWTMQSVTAVDGSQIPLRVVPMHQRGDSKGAQVATQMIITGALIPFVAPLVLLHGFKRGGDAYIPAGKRYEVFVSGQAVVKVGTAL